MSRTPTAASVTAHLQREAFAASDVNTAIEAVRLVYELRERPNDSRLLATACGWLWQRQNARTVPYGR